MVQGFTRLGIPVTLLQKGPRILPRDEPALVDKLVDKLRTEGVDLRFNVETEKVTVESGKKVVHGTEDGKPATWAADELLVAVGRSPEHQEHLGLEELGIETARPRAIVVDNRGRTSVDTVYACGDVAGRFLFTHSAGVRGRAGGARHVLPGQGQGRGRRAVVHVHRPRARPRRPHRGRGARACMATTSRCGARISSTTTGPGPTARPRARS